MQEREGSEGGGARGKSGVGEKKGDGETEGKRGSATNEVPNLGFFDDLLGLVDAIKPKPSSTLHPLEIIG